MSESNGNVFYPVGPIDPAHPPYPTDPPPSPTTKSAKLRDVERARYNLRQLAVRVGMTDEVVALSARLDRMAEDEVPRARNRREKQFWARTEADENGCFVWTGGGKAPTRVSPVIKWQGRQLSPRRIALEIQRFPENLEGRTFTFTQLCAAKVRGRYCINLSHFRIEEIPPDPERGLPGRPRVLRGASTPPTASIKEARPTAPIPVPAASPVLAEAPEATDASVYYCDRGHLLPHFGASCATCAQDRLLKRIKEDREQAEREIAAALTGEIPMFPERALTLDASKPSERAPLHDAPQVLERAISSDASTAEERAILSEAPTTSERAVPLEAPTALERVLADEAPTTSERASTGESSMDIERAIAPETPIASERQHTAVGAASRPASAAASPQFLGDLIERMKALEETM